MVEGGQGYLVAMVGGNINYSMVWEASRVANRKYQPKGHPVCAGDPIVLLHRATGTPLAADPAYTMDGLIICSNFLKTFSFCYTTYGAPTSLLRFTKSFHNKSFDSFI